MTTRLTVREGGSQNAEESLRSFIDLLLDVINTRKPPAFVVLGVIMPGVEELPPIFKGRDTIIKMMLVPSLGDSKLVGELLKDMHHMVAEWLVVDSSRA